MRQYLVQSPLGPLPLAAEDFPLTIGGASARLVVPGVPDAEIIAVLGLEADGPYVQPVGASGALRAHGAPLAESIWLGDGDRFEAAAARCRVEADGDRWTLIVEHEGGDNATEPPAFPEGESPTAVEALPARQAVVPVAFEAPVAGTAPRVTRRRIESVPAGASLKSVV